MFAVYGGADAGSAGVAAGVFAVTGGWAGGVDELGAAAGGALPALVVPVVFGVLVAPFAPGAADVADVALPALAATVADFAAGALVVPGAVAAAGTGAAALTPAAGVAAAHAPDGIANARPLAQPSAHAACSAARLALSERAQVILMRRARVEFGVFTTGFSTARYATEAACQATPARCTR